MKRKRLLYTGVFLAVLAASSCSKDLEELNIDPNNNTNIPPVTMLSNIQLSTGTLDRNTYRRTNISFTMMLVQQLASTEKLDGGEGDKYLKNDNCGALYEASYTQQLNNMELMMSKIKGDASQANLMAAARIWRVLIFQRLTDTYGDVPYFDAGKGATDLNFTPKYDEQRVIYDDMLKELAEAAVAFNPASTPVGNADLVYKGDITRWKKLAYSLMLRIGMRLQRKDPAKAKEWVQKAIAGGVMTDNNDICLMKYSGERNNVANPIAYTFSSYTLGDEKIKISKTFMDYLVATGDPRRAVYASLPGGDTTLATQKALPSGYDQAKFSTEYPGLTLKSFSTLNTKTILQTTAPTFFITTAEVQLMLAEAAVRGWTGGTAAEYYRNAVTSSMQQQGLYGAAGNIADADVQRYLNKNPFPAGGTTDEQLKTIGMQYWVATFLNGWESFANWRRTGIPALTPVNYNGNVTGGAIPRRLTYLLTEYVNNTGNIGEAVKRLGKDDYMSRIWWDRN